MGDMSAAFVRGWFQGALLMALALVLCGVLGRDCSRARRAEREREPAPAAWSPPKAKEKPAPARTRKPARDPGVAAARRWAACSGPACYHDVRPTAGGYAPSSRTPDVNAGLP